MRLMESRARSGMGIKGHYCHRLADDKNYDYTGIIVKPWFPSYPFPQTNHRICIIFCNLLMRNSEKAEASKAGSFSLSIRHFSTVDVHEKLNYNFHEISVIIYSNIKRGRFSGEYQIGLSAWVFFTYNISIIISIYIIF